MKCFLFVQDGCRPCHMVQTQLKRIENWEKYVKIVPCLNETGRTDLALKYGVEGTPTLVVEKKDGSHRSFRSPSKMTKSFWMDLFTALEKE